MSHRDDQPPARARRLLERWRDLDEPRRIGAAAVLLGGSWGLVGLLVAAETVARWVAALVWLLVGLL